MVLSFFLLCWLITEAQVFFKFDSKLLKLKYILPEIYWV